ncbi:zwei Ig domain protein zig-8-like [Periplaneta americana]|uniref:zwei Ig domain protein zig-8-like n=1 Tax=Periplaneta americana TaxID=6978 RepID=UPI0037E7698F
MNQQCCVALISVYIIWGSFHSAGVVGQNNSSDSEFVNSSEYTIVNVTKGRAVNLTCSVQKLSYKSLQWIRMSDNHTLTIGDFRYITDPRFKSSYNRDEEKWYLLIRQPKVTDSGLYMCQLQPDLSNSQYVLLNVIEPRTSVVEAPVISVPVGSPVNLTCLVVGDSRPPGHLDWFKGTKAVDYDDPRIRSHVADTCDGESQLSIAEVRFEDAGIYTCAPSNSAAASVLVVVKQQEVWLYSSSGGRQSGYVVGVLVTVVVVCLCCSEK